MSDILIVDDRVENLEMMRDILESSDYQVRIAEDANGTLQELAEQVPDLVLLDLWLRDSSLGGLELLKHIGEHHPQTPVVMISAHGNIETAVQAMELGAVSFVEKPISKKQLLEVVRRALEVSQLKRENAAFRERERREVQLVGSSKAMNHLRNKLLSAAKSKSRILFRGPPGTGKQEAARFVHLHSPRREGPFLVVGMDEVTGHAPDDRDPFRDLLSMADGGTMFLDEIGDLPEAFQSELLRVLTDQTLASSGTGGRRRYDVRVLSATTRDPEAMLKAGDVREDLYHRLAVLEFELPPLAARKRDIPQLVEHFMELLSDEFGRPPREVGRPVVNALMAHAWPGNVRELRNIVERLVMSDESRSGKPVDVAELPLAFLEQEPAVSIDADELAKLPLREAREEFERRYLLALVQRCEGNVAEMAEQAGMARTAMHRKLNDLGLIGPRRQAVAATGPKPARSPAGQPEQPQ